MTFRMMNDQLCFPEIMKFSLQGRLEKNEDFIKEGQVGNKMFFIVCDGVGGEKYGEVASRLACEAYTSFFEENDKLPVDENFFREATDFVETTFDDYLNMHPQKTGMATTVALLFFDEDRVWSIHAGDSRIYHTREDRILFQSRDHSVINELQDNGLISAEEAKHSNQKHVITRAIQGKKIRLTRTTVNLLNNIRIGDYFFICTDGVTGSISDSQLIKILSAPESNVNKTEIIKQLCEEKSHDNYSGYLIQLKEYRSQAV